MYKITKELTFPMGHRLSKHKGRCQFFHGHNFKVIIGVKTEHLNENGMVVDFSDLKAYGQRLIDMFDHSLMMNYEDDKIIDGLKELIPDVRLVEVAFEPTAENISNMIYTHYAQALRIDYPDVEMDFVTVYENERSSATYTED